MTGLVRLGVTVLVGWVATAGTAARGADPAATESELHRLATELAATQDRLKSLESDIARLSAATQSTHDALAAELAQPMLLLVGEGECPTGFTRVKVEAMLLTGPRTPKNSALIDAAGLADAEQVGVGSRVYRYLDFCYRAANAFQMK
jgi:hypothetical protein